MRGLGIFASLSMVRSESQFLANDSGGVRKADEEVEVNKIYSILPAIVLALSLNQYGQRQHLVLRSV